MRIQFSLLTLTLFIALAAGSAWAEEAPVDTSSDSSRPSNIEHWDEDEALEKNTWTFFGMGFESRQAATGASGASGTAAAGVSGVKKGKGK